MLSIIYAVIFELLVAGIAGWHYKVFAVSLHASLEKYIVWLQIYITIHMCALFHIFLVKLYLTGKTSQYIIIFIISLY